jgi:hypothetical protein
VKVRVRRGGRGKGGVGRGDMEREIRKKEEKRREKNLNISTLIFSGFYIYVQCAY